MRLVIPDSGALESGPISPASRPAMARWFLVRGLAPQARAAELERLDRIARQAHAAPAGQDLDAYWLED